VSGKQEATCAAGRIGDPLTRLGLHHIDHRVGCINSVATPGVLICRRIEFVHPTGFYNSTPSHDAPGPDHG